MIAYNAITAWGVTHPWPSREQVEQDMLLSKAICDIYENEWLAGELLLRGGTAINKLVLKQAYRYSEDLDFVRVHPGGIGDIMKTLTEMGKATGYQVKTRIGPFPKLYWYTMAQSGMRLRIKVEINTQERSPALPVMSIKHTVRSEWFSGEAEVKTFQFEEMAATKIRALYQRSKGRDLFDLWLLTKEADIDTELVRSAFNAYRPNGYTGKKARENLENKVHDTGFLADISNLLSPKVDHYHPDEAAEIIIQEYLEKL